MTGGPAEAGPLPSNPEAGASVGRTRPRREKRFLRYAPAPAGAALPPAATPAACGPPERRHVGGVDLVAVDRVIADLQFLVG